MGRMATLIKENISEDGTILNLREKYIGIRGGMELGAMKELENVRELILPGNQLADEGVEALANSPYLANLEAAKGSPGAVQGTSADAGYLSAAGYPQREKVWPASSRGTQGSCRANERCWLACQTLHPCV